MSVSIRFQADGCTLEGALYTTVTALQIVKRLPLELEMERWGHEYFGSLKLPLGAWLEPDSARTEMELGELAWWPEGNALCLFFGPTPASLAGEPRAVSPVNAVGRLRGDLSRLESLGTTIRARLERARI